MIQFVLNMSNGCALLYDVLPDLVPFVQFKDGEKHPWRSVTFNVFFAFLNFTNGTKSRNASHIKNEKL